MNTVFWLPLTAGVSFKQLLRDKYALQNIGTYLCNLHHSRECGVFIAHPALRHARPLDRPHLLPERLAVVAVRLLEAIV